MDLNLKNCNFKITYNTSDDQLSNDFYNIALSNSYEYYRGVGYFTSGWLKENSSGLAKFIQHGHTIKFITSPNLNKEDVKALEGKFDENKINELILSNINILEKSLEDDTRNLLGWLVYDGVLEFKFAMPINSLDGGEFHDKFGIFIDKENNFVAFNGSQNDSSKAYKNYESISVFKSWGDETSKTLAVDTLNRFKKIWLDNDSNLKIYTLGEVAKENLIKFRKYERPYQIKNNNIKNENKNMPIIPKEIKLRNYQETAYLNWEKNGYQGILSMATGSGKTITAFTSITKLFNKLQRLAVVVVVPYQHLLVQWDEEASLFNIPFIKCFESSAKWSQKLSNSITEFQFLQTNQLFVVVTNSTYVSKKFQAIIKGLDSLLLVVDEAHNFGAKDIRQKYLDNAKYKLGLSATPDRYMDDIGTSAMREYLGDIIFEYSLADAIKSGNLTPYNYYPILVHLTEEEHNEYIQLSKDIARIYQYNNGESNSQLELLLMKRSKIIASAENKISVLENLILDNKLKHSTLNLFYCSSKVYEEDDTDYDLRMVDKVNSMLTNIGMNVKNFTSLDSGSKEERKTLINNLKDEMIDGLVAIKCLDEGVDIPSVQRAFILSSSSNPKEFIQRRGRVLRKSPGKELAEIYDFIVVPLENSDSESFKYNRKFLAKELERYREFAKLAKNYPLCEIPLMDIIKEYNLEDI